MLWRANTRLGVHRYWTCDGTRLYNVLNRYAYSINVRTTVAQSIAAPQFQMFNSRTVNGAGNTVTMTVI